MGNVMLGFPNRIDDGALSGGSWQASLPLNNLKNRVQAKVARSTSAVLASTTFDVDLGATKIIRVLGLCNHNFSLAARVRVRASAVPSFAALDYDSGWVDVWPRIYGTDYLDWEDERWWSGAYSDEEKAGYSWLYTAILPFNTVSRYWRVEINDTTNPAGYVQLGRVFIGSVWQPEHSMSFGHTIAWETSTSVQAALSDSEYFTVKNPLRVVHFNVDWLSENQALESVFEIQRRAGIDKEVLFIHDPDETIHQLRRRFVGRFRQLNSIEHPSVVQHGAAFEIKETQ